jgi:hypothetical protein
MHCTAAPLAPWLKTLARQPGLAMR